MLEWALQLAPLVVVFGALATVVTTLNLRQTPSWLRFQGRVRGMGALLSTLYSASLFAGAYLLLALGAWLVLAVTGKPAPLPLVTCLLMAVAVPIVFALLSPLFKARKEPEDWLLWDKDQTEKR